MDQAAQLHQKLLAMNEALLLGSMRQQELTEAAEKLIEQLRAENTERMRVEVKLVDAKSAAEKANLAKSDFLSSMSHELRTPLHAILGFAQLMESGVPPPAPSQKANLEQILKAGWYLLALINEILDLATIESGRVTLSREPVSLVEIMLECRAMIEPQARLRSVAMTFPHLQHPCVVLADRTRVKQVLLNLLSNAIKYNKPGGAAVVECAPGRNTPDSIRISIRDTGMGLAPEQFLQLFEPFNRLGQEGGLEEGTGIGLVMCKQLVELMGGAIGADSTAGVGSVFWIELRSAPASQLSLPAAGPPAPLPPPATDATPPRTLLYVEDNPANLELLTQLIARRPDLRLLPATDGPRGIESARANQPAVILMDINMPGMSGIQALSILKGDPSTAHIPIIALTANAIPHDIEKGLKAGFFEYVTKPIRVDQFMDSLDAALRFSQMASRRGADDQRA